MIYRTYFGILCLLWVFASGSLVAEEVANLTFLPGLPVTLRDHIEISIDESLPGIKLQLSGAQALEGHMKMDGQVSGTPLTNPPFYIDFTLKGLQVHLKANNYTISYDSADPNGSMDMQQIRKLLNTPFKIVVDQDLTVRGGSEDLDLLVKELPILEDLQQEGFLADFFQHIFALVGKDLSKGKRIQKKSEKETGAAAPSVWDYEITSVTPEKIQAKISGVITPRNLRLNLGEGAEETSTTAFGLSFTGTVQGDITWDRKNALLFQMEMKHVYKGSLRLGNQEWSIFATLTHKADTTPLQP